MTERHGRHPARSRSPPGFNSPRITLPINLTGNPTTEVHLHTVPSSRREVSSNPNRTANTSTISNAGTVTTTYKIKTDTSRSSRGNSRARRSTLDNNSRPVAIPTTITVTPRHVHGTSTVRSESLHRSSEEEYVIVPSSRHGNHHHRDRHSHKDNTDIISVESEREGSRLRHGPPREILYTGARTRPGFIKSSRYAENIADDYDYEEDGYGYTKMSDLVRYDLDHTQPPHQRRGSFDIEKRPRPNSISSSAELVPPKYYEPRERGPPLSTRGFDRIRAENWEQTERRSPVSAQGLNSPDDLPPRFVPVNTVEHAQKQRVASYHDRPPPREEIYEMRVNQRRERPQQNWHDTHVEQRGFGIRSERNERTDRDERVDRSEQDFKEHREHSRGLDAIATGLGIAGAALGYAAVKNAGREDLRYREEREDRKRKDNKEENWRQSEREKIESHETSNNRVPTEPRLRDESNVSQSLKSPNYSSRDRADYDSRGRFEESRDHSRHESRERRSFRDDRSADLEQKEFRRNCSRSSQSKHSASGSSSSEGSISESRRKPSMKNLNLTAKAPFDPNNTSDLKALQQALNSKDPEAKNISNKIPIRPSRDSGSRDCPESRTIIVDRQSPPLSETKHARVVSPPREKSEEKPVKGILRQPRDKFPEDPAPIREGVAPLKDAKKDGIPPDARWTKIRRRLVNPEALEAGKERFEAREDFVIVLRVLTKEEVQAYADLTQKIRASHEEAEELEASQNRTTRRARNDKREKRDESHERRSHYQVREQDSYSDSYSDDTAADEQSISDNVRIKPTMLQGMPRRKSTFQEAYMSGGLSESTRDSSRTGLADTGSPVEPRVHPQYSGYVRNYPTVAHMPPGLMSTRKDVR
ncbi:hypothetical protein K3495_g3334 [Podosphaera aphanis]|nr:hypothetical protein K3495_g3334 [Podosphaera aphanis]